MQNNGHIERKSQEIAFALIRVAAYIRKTELKNRIDALSFKFVQWVAEERFDEALPALNALKNLVELGKHLLLIEPINAKILLKEIDSLNQAIRQSATVEPLPDLNTIFSNNDNTATEVSTPTLRPKVGGNGGPTLEVVGQIRQEKILEKIRQSSTGKIQLRDLIAEFPGISERTLRYDLKKLFDDGKVTRQGTGGPSNFYMLNQELSTGVINR